MWNEECGMRNEELEDEAQVARFRVQVGWEELTG
jgi:hypothetical protein